MKFRICNFKPDPFPVFFKIFSEKTRFSLLTFPVTVQTLPQLFLEWIVRMQKSGCSSMDFYSSLMTIDVNSFQIGIDTGPNPFGKNRKAE